MPVNTDAYQQSGDPVVTALLTNVVREDRLHLRHLLETFEAQPQPVLELYSLLVRSRGGLVTKEHIDTDLRQAQELVTTETGATLDVFTALLTDAYPQPVDRTALVDVARLANLH